MKTNTNINPVFHEVSIIGQEAALSEVLTKTATTACLFRCLILHYNTLLARPDYPAVTPVNDVSSA